MNKKIQEITRIKSENSQEIKRIKYENSQEIARIKSENSQEIEKISQTLNELETKYNKLKLQMEIYKIDNL